ALSWLLRCGGSCVRKPRLLGLAGRCLWLALRWVWSLFIPAPHAATGTGCISTLCCAPREWAFCWLIGAAVAAGYVMFRQQQWYAVSRCSRCSLGWALRLGTPAQRSGSGARGFRIRTFLPPAWALRATAPRVPSFPVQPRSRVGE